MDLEAEAAAAALLEWIELDSWLVATADAGVVEAEWTELVSATGVPLPRALSPDED